MLQQAKTNQIYRTLLLAQASKNSHFESTKETAVTKHERKS